MKVALGVRNPKHKLHHYCLMLGLPTILKSDVGPCFKSKPFAHFVEKYNIQHIPNSPYHHQSYGQAEKGIQEAKKMMKKLQQFNPYHIAHTLNKMEKRGNLGTPMDLFMIRPTRSLPPKTVRIQSWT